MDNHNYITDDDFLRDLRDYLFVLEPLPAASADHIVVGVLSDNPPVAELMERISEITWRGTIDGGATGCLLYTSPSPRDQRGSRMPSSA